MFLLSLVACGPEMATIEGIVYSSFEEESLAMPDARVRILDADGQVELASATTDGKGYFQVEVELGIHVYAEIDGEGLSPARFPGVVDLPVVQAEDRSLYGFPSDERLRFEEALTGCPGFDGPGLTVGEVRSYELATVVSGRHPTINNAQVLVRLADGREAAACYFDEEGTEYDPEALVTGESGRFALPGIPVGTHELEVTYQFGEGILETQVYPLHIGKGGTVAPWFPVWVGLP